MDFSMMEAKGSMMMLGEEVGVRIPRHLQTLIATIPGVGAAFATMLPLVGVVAAIAVIAKAVTAFREMEAEQDKIAIAQSKLGSIISTSMTGLEDKLLQAGIKADELSGNHLDKVHKELALIDHQSLNELAQEFGKLAGAADAAFGQMKAHWYQFGSGSDRAKHNLADFQAQYELLLSLGKNDEAATLLKARVGYEQQILALQKDVSSQKTLTEFGEVLVADQAKVNTLKAAGAGWSENEIKSQQDLVNILNAQIRAQEVIKKTAGIEKSNVVAEDKKSDSKGVTEVAYNWKKAEGAISEADKQQQAFWEHERKAVETSNFDRVITTAKNYGKEQEEMIKTGERFLRSKEKEEAKLISLAKARAAATERLYKDEVRYANDAVAQAILGGHNLAQSMARIGQQMLADAIRYALTEVETKIGLHTAMEAMLKMLHLGTQTADTAASIAATKAQGVAAAGLAGANATASFSLAPWPIDMGAAGFGASMMAAAMGMASAETGGKIPGSGAVPILGHGGETVVTKALTDRVERSEGNGNPSRSMTNHINFAPQIHAVDAQGVDSMLKKHSAIFQRHITSALRRANR